MTQSIQFEDLLGTVNNNGDSDLDEVEEELKELEAERKRRYEELSEVESKIREIKIQRNKAVRKAVKAAEQLGLEVPEEYKNLKSSTSSRKSKGKYEWSAEGVKTKQQTVSSAMWRLSKGSGGSAGSNGQGVLRSGEFWQLIEEQTGKSEEDIEAGDELTVELPNERVITFRRVES